VVVLTTGSATRRQRAAIAALSLLLIAAVAAGVLIATRGRPRTGPAAGLPARSAAQFLDSVGVNVHISYYDTAYGQFDRWSPALRELGVRHIRDGLVFDQPQYVAELRRLAAEGVRATLIVGDTQRPPQDAVALATGPLRPAVEALEGPNEIDATGGNWEGVLRTFMPQLRAAQRASALRGLPLLGPSFVQHGSRTAAQDLAGAWDIDNVHPYPGGHEPGSNIESEITGIARPGRPIMATETGYHDALDATTGQPPVPDDVAAAYIPRLYLEYFAAGVRRTFLYELLDEKPDPGLTAPEQHFGLMRSDLAPKPAFTALRDLLQVIRTSPGGGDAPPVTVSGGGDVRTLLLQRADGSRVLLLWRRASLWDPDARRRERVDDVGVAVRFAGTARDLATYRPAEGAAPVARAAEADGVRVAVGGDVTALSFR
jgi:hypothetical protein